MTPPATPGAVSVKERPILFTGAMVRAILAGTKTQTRRLVKPQPPAGVTRANIIPWPNASGSAVLWSGDGPIDPLNGMDYKQRHPRGWNCPYGFPSGEDYNGARVEGTRLWVRETIGLTAKVPTSTWDTIKRDGFALPGWIAYRADQPEGHWCWRPSIHMPRWASRITLEITDVRVQRLQDIDELDALAEGVEGERLVEGVLTEGGKAPRRETFVEGSARDGYRSPWESINGAGSWDANPWVWCITFKRVAEVA